MNYLPNYTVFSIADIRKAKSYVYADFVINVLKTHKSHRHDKLNFSTFNNNTDVWSIVIEIVFNDCEYTPAA